MGSFYFVAKGLCRATAKGAIQIICLLIQFDTDSAGSGEDKNLYQQVICFYHSHEQSQGFVFDYLDLDGSLFL